MTVEATGGLALSGVSFISAGGTLTNHGAFSLNSGTFAQRAGMASGNAVVVTNCTLDDDLGAAAGAFTLDGGTLTGSGANPGVAAGQVVTMPASNSSIAVAKDINNAGAITLGDAPGGYVQLYGPGVTLTNGGQVNTILGGGGARYLTLNITNSLTGTIDIAGDTQMGSGATLLANDGTVTVEATGGLALSGVSFTQGASGMFATTIDATTTAFGQLSAGGGAVTLAGKLKVTTIGSSAIATSWPIISDANRSGSFDSVDLGITNYDVQYPPAGVTLSW